MNHIKETFKLCGQDILKTIEVLIKNLQNEGETTDSEPECKPKDASDAGKNVAASAPLDTEFSQIRKQFGFKKKKPKNSFVRHKANYENAMREQAAKVAVLNTLSEASTEKSCNGKALLETKPQFKPAQQPAPASYPMFAQQHLLSMFDNSSGSPSVVGGGCAHLPYGSAASSIGSRSPPQSLLSSRPLSSMSSLAANLNHHHHQQRSMMAARNLILNPSLMMPNNASLNGRDGKSMSDMEAKLNNHQFMPNTSTANGMMADMPRNLFDSLMTNVGYKNLFPSIFSGTAPNLASLNLLSGAMPGLGLANTGDLATSTMPQCNFDSSLEGLSQKMSSSHGLHHSPLWSYNHQANGNNHSKCDD